MPTQKINSPIIKSVSHENVGLTVEFARGARYRYTDAPMAEYVKMTCSPDPVKYYNENIKNRYSSLRLVAGGG